MAREKRFKNPWAKGGEYYPDWLDGQNMLESEDSSSANKWLGGEVTNETDKFWLISGGSNSNEKDFIWLPPNTNSDDLPSVNKQLGGDVDAVWPAGQKLKNYYSGQTVTSGAFKLRDHKNTNIIKKDGEYIIYDFSEYFPDNKLPSGWKLPQKFKK
jgi:hypothetical protein